MPQYDIAMLITLDIGLALLGLILTFIGIWAILHEMKGIAASNERIAGMAERLDARLRRQYADIDRELQSECLKNFFGDHHLTALAHLAYGHDHTPPFDCVHVAVHTVSLSDDSYLSSHHVISSRCLKSSSVQRASFSMIS